jgi:hypothetical protein
MGKGGFVKKDRTFLQASIPAEVLRRPQLDHGDAEKLAPNILRQMSCLAMGLNADPR